MSTKQQELKQEIVVYQLVAVIYQKEQGPVLGIFREEADAQAIIDQTPAPERNWLRIEPVIVGRTAGYRQWLSDMHSDANEARARDEGLDELVDENPGHETELNK
ncbi:MAG TPA: hypothetical protein VFA39_20120 [Steroidobacteraceae bacterium]|nr:hypothetical protein [Steroidobacteraceae bacterium]